MGREKVFKVVLQKSIPARIRQLILYISNNEGKVEVFVGELSFAKRPYKNFLWDKAVGREKMAALHGKGRTRSLQGYLVHKKQRPPRTSQ